MLQQENLEVMKAENHRLRHTLLVVVSERKKMASQLTGVQNLDLQLQKKAQELKSLSDKNERLQSALSRAENRIIQLSVLADNGQTLAGQGAIDIVTPGVSKKVLEALTRENTKLRQALDHLTNRGPNGVDLAVENRELRDERDMKSNELIELRSELAAVQEDQQTEVLKNQVLRLTAQNSKLERNLDAKQVFCETIVTENETLKNELQTIRDEKITRVQDLKRGLGDVTRTHPEVKQIVSQVYDNQDSNSEHDKERERLRQQLQELQNNHEAKTREFNDKQKQIGKLQMEHKRMQNAHKERQRELQNDLEALNRECDDKQQQIDELQMEQGLMQGALQKKEQELKSLSDTLQKKEQELKSLSDKSERLQSALSRAENRITQLADNGQTLAGQGAFLKPGVSKKVLEALTRENTKLRQALDHLTNRGPNGVDLAVENRELHEIVMTLRDERDMKSNELIELKSVLAAVQEDQQTEVLKNQVLRLTAQNSKLERNLDAKQVFCETIVTENETLKNELQTLKDEKTTRVQDLKRGLGDVTRTHPEVKQIVSQVYDNQDSNSEHDKERERLRQQLQELQNNLEAKTREFNDKQKQIGELQMEHKRIQNAHKERQWELQNDLEALKRECDDKQQQIDELQMEQGLMQGALAGYENDFRMEQQEKKRAFSDQQKITREQDHVHSDEQLKKEHIGLRQNIERMYSQAQTQQQYEEEKQSYSSLKEENGHLRGRLSELVTEGRKMTSEYDCVKPRLQKKGQFNNTLLAEKCQLIADVLERADNKMTQLTSQESINTPETSKKVLEALARENTRLKQALDCLTNKGPNDVDVAMGEESGFEDSSLLTKRECKDGKSQLPELQLELAMLRNVLAGYENDFNAVKDEKVKAVADGEKSVDQLKKENAILKKNLEWTRAELQALVPFASQASDRLSVYDPIQADCMDAQDFHVLGNRLRPTMPCGYGLEPCADGRGPADLRDARDSPALKNRLGRSCSPQLCIHSFGVINIPLGHHHFEGAQ